MLLQSYDTAPDCSGTSVKPILHKNYNGYDIVLPDDTSQVLRMSDFVKFAKFIPDEKDKTGCFEIIKNTIINLEKSEFKEAVPKVVIANEVKPARLPDLIIQAGMTGSDRQSQNII